MNTGVRKYRWFATVLLAVGMVTGAGIARSGDRVNEICIYGGQISYCAPDGS